MLQTMPLLFIGHGSPLNAIQQNDFTNSLKTITNKIPVPKAILVISAHWVNSCSAVTGAKQPHQIYDFGGFPKELYHVLYTPPGNEYLANICFDLGKSIPVSIDNHYGIDHGAWTILKHMYPLFNIPVLQLSIDNNFTNADCFSRASGLGALRDQGVLIIGSGNIVHNLQRISYEQYDQNTVDWAQNFDLFIKKALQEKDSQALINYNKIMPYEASLAVPTNEHYVPLLYIEGMRRDTDTLQFFYEGFQHQSLSMRSYILQ